MYITGVNYNVGLLINIYDSNEVGTSIINQQGQILTYWYNVIE